MKQLRWKERLWTQENKLRTKDIILESIHKWETSKNRADTSENWITGTEERVAIPTVKADEYDKKNKL